MSFQSEEAPRNKSEYVPSYDESGWTAQLWTTLEYQRFNHAARSGPIDIWSESKECSPLPTSPSALWANADRRVHKYDDAFVQNNVQNFQSDVRARGRRKF